MLTGARGTVTGEDELEYRMLVSYASSLVDTLLFIHYIGVILIELRHLQSRYYVKVIFFRLPSDGEKGIRNREDTIRKKSAGT